MESATPAAVSSPGRPGGTPGGPVTMRIAVGARLRRHREAAGICREQAAYLIRTSVSTISCMELGRVRFDERDVADLLGHYDVHDPVEHAEFLVLIRQANTDGWWQPYRNVVPSWFEAYLSMEREASLIRVYAMQFLPELLQTDDYARLVVGTDREDPLRAEWREQLRHRRQARLTAPDGPRLWAVLDEGVLRRSIADPGLRQRQMDHLLDVAGLPNVCLQVARFDRPTSLAIGGAFTVLRFPTGELGDVIYLEHLNSALYIDEPTDVEAYQQAWVRMCATVEPPRGSTELIESLRTGDPLDRAFRPAVADARRAVT